MSGERSKSKRMPGRILPGKQPQEISLAGTDLASVCGHLSAALHCTALHHTGWRSVTWGSMGYLPPRRTLVLTSWHIGHLTLTYPPLPPVPLGSPFSFLHLLFLVCDSVLCCLWNHRFPLNFAPLLLVLVLACPRRRFRRLTPAAMAWCISPGVWAASVARERANG